MLANYNLWILDVNLLCFFTFAPIEKIKTFCRSKQAAPRKHMFDILSQPFEATFLSNHDGINAMVSYGKLHILGLVNQRIYYLEYGLLFESGMLRLLKYQPLFTSGQTIKTTFMKAAALRRSSS